MSTLTMAKEVPGKQKQRGLYILGLSKAQMRRLRRAIKFAGYPSLSSWIDRQRRTLLKEQEAIHGDLLKALTPDERDVIGALGTGATSLSQVSDETGLSEKQAERVLADLLDAGIIELRRAIKITDQARGATNPEYRISPKYREERA
jgi:hypothetical protein